MLSLLFLAAFFGPCIAQTPATFSCSKWWPGGTFTVHDQCSYIPGYENGQLFGGSQEVNVTVVYTQGWLNSALASIEVVTPILSESLSQSIAYYVTFGNVLPTQVVVILTSLPKRPGIADTATSDTWFPGKQSQPCQIRTFPVWTENTVNNRPRSLFAIAHEMYHCAQQFVLYQEDRDPNNYGDDPWIIEGSASYMANLVFPLDNVERVGPNNTTYDPTLPIYQNNPYNAEILFQSLEFNTEAVDINNWVMDNAPDYYPTNRTHLSKISDFIDKFYSFAKQYALKLILDTDGFYIQDLTDIIPTPATVTLSPDGNSGKTSLITVPDSITTFNLSLSGGQTVILTSTASANQRVAYRLPNDPWWSDMPSGTSSGSEGYAVLPCNDDGTPVTILVLYVSSSDAANDIVDINIQQQNTDQNCPCFLPGGGGSSTRRRGITKRGLQGCGPPASLPSSGNNSTNPSSGNGTCQASSLTDPCLSKTWTLNLPALQSLLETDVESEGTVNSISLSGTGQLDISGTSAGFTYSNFEVDIDFTVIGIDLPTTTVINGDFDSYLYVQSGGNGAGTFCLVVYKGEGTATETDSLTGGFSLDLGPQGGFITSEMVMSYTCDAESLTMTGTLNGVTVAGPWVYSSS